MRDGPLHHFEREKTTFTQCSLTTIVRFLLLTEIYTLQILMHILNFTLGFCKQEKRLCTHTVFRATCNFRHHLGLGTYTPELQGDYHKNILDQAEV